MIRSQSSYNIILQLGTVHQFSEKFFEIWELVLQLSMLSSFLRLACLSVTSLEFLKRGFLSDLCVFTFVPLTNVYTNHELFQAKNQRVTRHLSAEKRVWALSGIWRGPLAVPVLTVLSVSVKATGRRVDEAAHVCRKTYRGRRRSSNNWWGAARRERAGIIRRVGRHWNEFVWGSQKREEWERGGQLSRHTYSSPFVSQLDPRINSSHISTLKLSFTCMPKVMIFECLTVIVNMTQDGTCKTKIGGLGLFDFFEKCNDRLVNSRYQFSGIRVHSTISN